MIDSDRKGRIILNSAANENANQAASLFIGVPGQANTWKSLDGALTLTRDGPGGNWLLSFEGGSIDLGSSLDQGQLGMRWIDTPVEPQINGSTLLGDRKPLTPEELAGQSPTDVLGNVRTSDTPQVNRADTLSGSANNDHIQSLGGNDIIDGKDGDDYIEAGGGRDRVQGGQGADLLVGGTDSDILLGGAGDDVIYAESWVSLAQAWAEGNSQQGTGERGDWLSGNDGDDILVGGRGNDVLFGGAGSDLLLGGAGDDLLMGDVDWITDDLDWYFDFGESLVHFAQGQAHPDQYGNDVLYGGAGNDRIYGGRGNDVLYGEAGNDILAGNGDDDTLFGGDGDDVLYGDGIEIIGETERFAGNDYLDGGAGNDALHGGDGDDILIGGTGDDILIGGRGRDTYIFNKGDGVDVLIDNWKEGNILKFGAGFNSQDAKLHLGSLLLDFGDGDQIHIENFDPQDAENSVSIDRFEFADGTTLSAAQLLERGFDIDGVEGDNILTGTSVTDRMRGFGGNDCLYGGKGDDVLDGGGGQNLLMGAEGDDSYIVRSADVALAPVPEGQPQMLTTTIDDALGSNRIRLDVAEQPLSVVKVNEGYGLLWAANGGQAGVHLQNMGTAGHASIEFSDGRTVTVRQIVGEGLAQEQYVYSNTTGEVLIGGALNDELVASGQGSVFSGGRGDDYLGLEGQDQTVEYRRGDGQDTLGGGGRGAVIALQGEFDPQALRLEVDGQGRLSLWLGNNPQTGAGERLFLNLYLQGLAQARLLESIRFDDGTEVSFASLLEQGVRVQGTAQDDVLTGTDLNDTFVAGTGADWWAGGAGDDVYEIDAGSSAVIDDAQGFNRVLLKNASDWAAVTLSRPVAEGNDLLLEINGEATVTLSNALLRSDKFAVALADGSYRLLSDLIQELGPQVIVGGWDNDVMQAGAQGSLLDGAYGDDVVVGGAGDDWLLGGDGNDVLDGHGGDDVLMGGDGDDTYIVRLAPGQQQLIDIVGHNRVRFGAGIAASQLEVLRPDESTDVLIQVDANQSLLVRRGLEGAVEAFEFDDGTVWTYGDLINRFASPSGLVLAGDDESNTLNGSSGADLLIGQQGDDVLYGFDGDDELQGGDGDDTLAGGRGNDLLAGGDGQDTYVLNRGDGIDRLVDTQGVSKIRFGAGISLQDLSATRVLVEGEAYVRLQYGAGDAILIGQGAQLTSSDAVRFADGSTVDWNTLQLKAMQTGVTLQAGPGGERLYGTAAADALTGGAGNDHLMGGAGNDVLEGGAGDDVLEGGAGADTYVIGVDGGRDTLMDDGAQPSTILLDQADTAGLSFARLGNGLLVGSSQLNSSFYIPSFYTQGAWTLKLSDGSAYDLAQLAAPGLAGASMEGRRDSFYNALLARVPAVTFGWGNVALVRDGEQLITDAEGNETVFSLSTQRVQTENDAGEIVANADDLATTWERSFLRSEHRVRTYEVVDVSYRTSETMTPGRSYQVIQSPGASYGGSYSYSSLVPTGYTSYYDSQGRFFVKEPDRITVTRTPVYTTRLVQEDYWIDLWKTENRAVRTIEDIRAGDQDNTITLSGSASKLVDAGGGNDVIMRTGSLAYDRIGEKSELLGDWAYGGDGDDVIRLGAGDDELSGGNGNDYLDGGAGADVYVVSADDEGWDIVYDSAAATVYVNLDAGWYGILDQELADKLASLMINPMRMVYSEGIIFATTEPGSARVYATRAVSGDVAVTAANLNALLAIDRARPDRGKSVPGSWDSESRSILWSDGLDSLIASATNSPLVTYGFDYSTGVEVLRPAITFTDGLPRAFSSTCSDTVRFGVGVSLADLQLTWGVVELDDATQQVLNISWGGPGGVRVVVPELGAPVGIGIEQFEFADGTRLSMDQMMALAPARPSFYGRVSAAQELADVQLREDQSFGLTLPGTVFDVAGNRTARYTARLADSGAPLPDWLQLDSRTGVLSGVPGNEAVGELRVEIRAAVSPTVWATQVVQLSIRNVNDAPIATLALEDQSIDAGQTWVWQVPQGAFVDEDAGDRMSYKITMADGSALPSWLSFDVVNQRLVGTPGSANVGGLQLRVTATDLSGAKASSLMNVNVQAVARQELIGSQGADQLDAGLLASDLYGLGGDDVLRGSAAADRLVGGSGNDMLAGGEGDDTYVFRLGDGADVIRETGSGANIITFGEGVLATGVSVQRDGADLVVHYGTLGDTIRIASTDGVTVPVHAIQGLVLADGTQLALAQLLNAAPLAAAEEAVLDEAIAVTVSGNVLANDTDPDASDVLAVSNPGTYQGLYGVLVLNPDGTYTYTLDTGHPVVRALAQGESLSEAFGYGISDGSLPGQSELTITIVGRNDQPLVLAPVSNQSVQAYTPYSYQIPAGAFGDVDAGDSLTYRLSLTSGAALPAWLQFDPASRTLSGRPDQGDAGTLQLQIVATDSQGASALQTFQLVVTPLPVSSGGANNDVLSAHPSGSVLYGLGGNDRLHGDVGNDVLYGGDGNDKLYAWDGDDILDGGDGDDILTGDAGHDLLYGGAGNDSLFGGDGDDVLHGGDGNDYLEGNAGRDVLYGGPGDDAYLIEDEFDTVSELADEGVDTIQSYISLTLGENVEHLTLLGSAAINATGNALGNELVGNSAANVLRGMAGDDYLYGMAGDDILDGGEGADGLYGGAGNDTYYVDNPGDWVQEGANQGTDTVISTVSWTLGANIENLILAGNAAINGTGNGLANVMIGNDAANALSGGGGADILDGQGGSDTLTGGAGNDTYVFGRGYGVDTVVENDSTIGNTDVAQFLAGIDADQIWFRRVGNNLEASIIGTSDALVLKNWYLGSQYHVEQFKTADGKVLLDSQVQNLVQAMAQFSPPAAGQTTLPASYEPSLQPVIAANWQ
ncbi:MAG: putative Ig domain-containing protein [Anaerolineae bacterium]|nr:putative Ig domain-containing protein [Anaerolineae bacterium]